MYYWEDEYPDSTPLPGRRLGKHQQERLPKVTRLLVNPSRAISIKGTLPTANLWLKHQQTSPQTGTHLPILKPKFDAMSQYNINPSPRAVPYRHQEYPQYQQHHYQYHEHESQHVSNMESSTSASESNSNSQNEQAPQQLLNTHPLESILRMANNDIGVDSRDNVLRARKGERPTTLAKLIEK